MSNFRQMKSGLVIDRKGTCHIRHPFRTGYTRCRRRTIDPRTKLVVIYASRDGQDFCSCEACSDLVRMDQKRQPTDMTREQQDQWFT